jgi:hypothetical protein
MPSLIALCLLFLQFTQPCIAQTTKLRSAVGTNLDSVTYWASELPFVDVMKSSSTWISGDSSQWDNKQRLDLDADGWVRSLAPGQVAHTLMLREIGDRYPAGRYLVRYKGQGRLKFEYAARVVSQERGEIVLQVAPANGGIHMVIEATDPADYLRDIVITMPGGICEGDPFTHAASPQPCKERRFLPYAEHSKEIVFNPVFLGRLRMYSVLRFVNWMQTNHSPVRDWSQRTRLSSRTWTADTGVPIEVMIALANRTGAHPWFNVPHQADDAYARSFAQTVKESLDPTLHVYVEHSNEVWNAQFSQSEHIARQAAAQVPGIDSIQYHGLRSRTLGAIFKEILGSGRVVAVLGAQAGNRWTGSRALEYLKSRFKGALGIDALAIGPYFAVMPGPKDSATFAAMTLDALFDHVRGKVLPATAATVRRYRDLAGSYGIPLIAYEGGQHLVGIQSAENNERLTALFHAFNRDPRIKQLYLDYLGEWKRAGGSLFVHYFDVGRYSKWGSWGALEYLEQPRTVAPKFDALQTFVEQNPVWWTQ